MPGANEHQRPVIFTQATHAVTELVQQVLQIFEGDGMSASLTASSRQITRERKPGIFPCRTASAISSVLQACIAWLPDSREKDDFSSEYLLDNGYSPILAEGSPHFCNNYSLFTSKPYKQGNVRVVNRTHKYMVRYPT